MSAAPAANPFSPRTVLAMLLFGALAFILTLYFIGADETGGDNNNGGGHAAGKGLNGYAALVRLVEKSGYDTVLNRNEGALGSGGLLVLTPPHGADGKELERIVSTRRYSGPTIVVVPKWLAFPVPGYQKNARKGWVELYKAVTPEWKGFADDLSASIGPVRTWRGGGTEGSLADGAKVQSGEGAHLVPLITDGSGTRVLAAYRADGGVYPELAAFAGLPPPAKADDEYRYPVIFVFEPDLLDNYGMAHKANALLAMRLVDAASERTTGPVMFDLTQNGLGRSMNLLTLAFTPPFLAATLCLLIAAAAIGWRAFRRFGPPLAEARAIAFGKRQLVENAAGFIRRTGRLHLLGKPYAMLMRRRIARKLALPWSDDPRAMDEAIERALAARGEARKPFFTLTEKLGHARGQHELLREAQVLKQTERMLGP